MIRTTKMMRVWLAIWVAVLLLAALPTHAFATDDLVRFTVDNRSSRDITVRLYSTDGSGRAYYMVVGASTLRLMTPERGVYDYRLTACGIMVFGTVNLTKTLTWYMPECGTKGGPDSKAAHTQDVGKDILPLVKVDLINSTGSWLQVWLSGGPYPYMFILAPKTTRTVSILKGSYVWSHYSCGGAYSSGVLVVRGTTHEKEFTCP